MAKFKVGVQLHPQATTVEQMRSAWKAADALEVDSIWVWDHFYPLYGDPDAAHFEAYTLLAAMAADTTHAQIGAQIALRHNLSPKVVNAIAAHHQEVEYSSLEAPIVQVADAISASRPGARGESIETYVRRLEDLQAIAESFEGVERSFAVQAGREVRILVRPDQIDDVTASRLARDVVKKIEASLTYPGQIKVTVIRETRAVEYAK